MAYSMHCAVASRSYFEALETAEKRALHSFFDQHVIEDDELGYFALDEGDGAPSRPCQKTYKNQYVFNADSPPPPPHHLPSCLSETEN